MVCLRVASVMSAVAVAASTCASTGASTALYQGITNDFEDPASLVLLQTRSEMKKPALAKSMGGATAPLNERGYQALANLKDDNETKVFVRRVAAELGYTTGPGSAGGLKGFVPYFSGSKATRTFAALEKELTRIAGLSKNKNWLVPKGTHASLDEVGFLQVAKLKDSDEMAPFVKRVAADMLDMEAGDAGLKGLAPFYSGETGHGSFSAMKEELLQQSQKENGWLHPMHEAVKNEGQNCSGPCKDALTRGSICNIFCGKGHLCTSNSSVSDKELFVCTKVITGASQPLNKGGFAVVQGLKNSTQMERFVRRVIDTLDLMIINEKALKVVVPYYSGEKDKRSYDTMLKEVGTVGNQTDSWLSRRGMTAPLEQSGYEIVKNLDSIPEMAKFIRRAVDAKDLYVRSDGWLNGLAAFYGGEETKTNFAAMQKELRDLANDPNLGHKGDNNDPNTKKLAPAASGKHDNGAAK